MFVHKQATFEDYCKHYIETLFPLIVLNKKESNKKNVCRRAITYYD